MIININFNKLYNPERKIVKVVFSDLVTDYNMYLNIDNKDMIKTKTVVIDI